MTENPTSELDPQELTDDQGKLGIETEPTEDDFHDIERPWNPDLIRVSTKTFSLRNMLDQIAEDSLDLTPDFQRLRVWKLSQKAQLIESILLQIPLPAFYFAEDEDGRMRVVDGVQRLTTINDFARGGVGGKAHFPLNGLEYIGDLEGRYFVDLPPLWQRRLYNTQIVAHVIDPTTPAPVMYDIFRRINTGGTPLNAQEIRHCMSKDRSRDFLKRLTAIEEFDMATAGLLRDQRRMIDREVALRFVAFWIYGAENYFESMEDFLFKATEILDDPKQISDRDLERMVENFRVGLERAYFVFGEHAFRKWPIDDESLKPFNRALFESWTVELASYQGSITSKEASGIRDRAREAMRHDSPYLASISAATGDRQRVYQRFYQARNLIETAAS